MPTKEEYLTNMQNALKGSSPQNAAGAGSSGDPDYYQMLKSESYKELLSKEVQAHNAEQQALKYTANGLRGSGFGTQGIGESTRLGIGNALGSALRSAQTDYESAMQGIAQQEKQAKNDQFESLTTLMGSASSSGQLGEMMAEYGYGGYDKDGNFQWNEEGLKGLDENTRRQLKILYGMYDSELQNNEWLSSKTINGTGYRDAGTAIQNVVDSKGEQGTVSNELRKIFSDSYLKDKKVSDGYAVKLANGSDDGKVVYMIYRNGTWYQTTANVYNAASRRDYLHGEK